MKEPKQLSSKEVYKGAIFNVKEKQFLLEDCSKPIRQIVEKNNSVLVLLVDDFNHVYIQDEFRAGLNKVTTGFCAGLIEKNEEPEDAAIREVKEETGMTVSSSQLESLGGYALSEGFTNEKTFIFVVKVSHEQSVNLSEQHLDKDEFITGGRWTTINGARGVVSSMSGQFALAEYMLMHS